MDRYAGVHMAWTRPRKTVSARSIRVSGSRAPVDFQEVATLSRLTGRCDTGQAYHARFDFG